MSITSVLHVATLVAAETEEHHEQVINPWIVGLIVLGLLLAMLGALVAFGGGREHT